MDLRAGWGPQGDRRVRCKGGSGPRGNRRELRFKVVGPRGSKRVFRFTGGLGPMGETKGN